MGLRALPAVIVTDCPGPVPRGLDTRTDAGTRSDHVADRSRASSAMTSAACFSRSGIHGPSSGTMPPTVRAMSGSCLPALLGLGLPLLLGLGPVERGPLGELPAAHL